MSGTHISVNDRDTQNKIKTLIKKAASLKPVFIQIGEYMDESTRERFDREKGPSNKDWKKISSTQKKHKARKGLSSKILHAHRTLRDTLAGKPSNTNLLFGSALVYAATHQFGDKKRNIPARPYLGINASDKIEIKNILTDHLSGE